MPRRSPFPLTLLLLFFVFGSLVSAAMPLIIAAVAVIGTLLELRLLNGVTPVSIYAVNLATVLGLGLAIDYSLFIVTRFREELSAGHDTATALEETMAHAGRTVAGSAVTMAAAASALLVFPLVFLRSFAYSGIAVVLLAGAAALVVLPAVLALLGPRINSLTVWRRSVRPPAEGFWSKTARGVMRRPVLVIIPVVVGLAVLAAPVVHLRLGDLDDRVLSPTDQVGRSTTPCGPISARVKPTRSRSSSPTPATPPRSNRRPLPYDCPSSPMCRGSTLQRDLLPRDRSRRTGELPGAVHGKRRRLVLRHPEG
jgi:RND superfamily putative drug exporter